MAVASYRIRFDGEDLLEFQADLPADPMPAGAMLPLVRGIGEALIQIGASVSPQPTTCRAGCTACCDMAIPVSPVEASRLREVIEALPEERQAEVRKRFAEAVTKLRAAVPQLDDLFQPDRERRADLYRYFTQRVACPFLDLESGCCTVYEERPLICREFLVTSPAENCAREDGEGVVRAPLPARASDALTMTLAGTGNGGRGSKRAPVLPLVTILEWDPGKEADAGNEVKLPPEQWLRRFIHELETNASNLKR